MAFAKAVETKIPVRRSVFWGNMIRSVKLDNIFTSLKLPEYNDVAEISGKGLRILGLEPRPLSAKMARELWALDRVNRALGGCIEWIGTERVNGYLRKAGVIVASLGTAEIASGLFLSAAGLWQTGLMVATCSLPLLLLYVITPGRKRINQAINGLCKTMNPLIASSAEKKAIKDDLPLAVRRVVRDGGKNLLLELTKIMVASKDEATVRLGKQIEQYLIEASLNHVV